MGRLALMQKKTLEQLDYYRLREKIAGYAASEEGKNAILRREPLTREQIDEINSLKTLSSQWQKALTSKNPIRLDSWNEISSFLKLLQADGTTLEQEQLYSLWQFASSALDLYSNIKTSSSELGLKNLLDLAESLPYSTLEQTQNIVSRIIDKNGELKDLPVLREILNPRSKNTRATPRSTRFSKAMCRRSVPTGRFLRSRRASETGFLESCMKFPLLGRRFLSSQRKSSAKTTSFCRKKRTSPKKREKSSQKRLLFSILFMTT